MGLGTSALLYKLGTWEQSLLKTLGPQKMRRLEGDGAAGWDGALAYMAQEWLFPFSLFRVGSQPPSVQHNPQDAGAGADCGDLHGGGP